MTRARSTSPAWASVSARARRDPANLTAAEEAFQTAIAIASRQAARSFELRATLSLAKLWQSTGHPADAHAVLTPALEGFSPAAEMPEIAEVQALLAAPDSRLRLSEGPIINIFRTGKVQQPQGHNAYLARDFVEDLLALIVEQRHLRWLRNLGEEQ